MPIVGTAGHVDHGKSTLVLALTGSDPDRWAEEKERGLTIDLGFAWTDIGDHDVGFVDVPGHEKFIKNMLAGVGAVDCALLVVAADSGWMPQTEEHAAVLDLLEVEHGVIAITRIDLVDADTAELAVLEVMDEVEGSALADWEIVCVSAVTGEGIDDLRTAIAGRLDRSGSTASNHFRMWIDRVFTIDGAGLVATGTVMSGVVHVGDELQLEPHDSPVRVRALHHHGGPVDHSVAGSRTAVNLIGAHAQIERGDVLATSNTTTNTDRLLAALSPTRAFDEIPDRGAFHLHVGTASRLASIRRLDDLEAFVITLDEPVPVTYGDRIILRDSGRRAIVGGGRVLDPHPSQRPNDSDFRILAANVDAALDERATALLIVHGTMSGADVSKRSGGGIPIEGLVAGTEWISVRRSGHLERGVIDHVTIYHTEYPMRPGIPKSELASKLMTTTAVIDAIVAQSDEVTETTGSVHLADFTNDLDAAAEERWEIERITWEQSLNVPRLSASDLPDEVIHFVLRRGDLVQVADDLAFTESQVAQIVDGVADLADGFSVADFRDHFGMARRQAVPVLEWLDSIGRTRRSGDGRVVRSG